jgi:hypothetical protein
MRFSVYTLVAAAVAVNAQTATLTSTVVAAPTVSSNPKGASYTAKLPEKGTVRGSIIGTSGNDGVGVQFSISVSGLPSEGGPFSKLPCCAQLDYTNSPQCITFMRSPSLLMATALALELTWTPTSAARFPRATPARRRHARPVTSAESTAT